MTAVYRMIMIPVILLFASTAWADQWQMDPDHTEIRFEIDHILTTVSGYFTDFKGDVFFDPENPDTASFNFTVKVKSIDTNNGKRDNHLRSKDFFSADDYPEMTFKTTSVKKQQNNIYALKGMLTIKDVTKEIETTFTFLSPKPHPFVKGKDVGGFVTRFRLDRLDYHVGSGKFLEMGVVGREVDVEIVMEAFTER